MMALITTMFTSPLLHFIWIRNQRKKAAPLLHGNSSFNLFMRSYLLMIFLIRFILCHNVCLESSYRSSHGQYCRYPCCSKREKVFSSSFACYSMLFILYNEKIINIFMQEVTDSPSSYFFAHRKPVPPFIEIIRERTRALMLPLKVKQIFAVNVEDDIFFLLIYY